MALFRYRAANADDRPQTGSIEAVDLADAARSLIDRGLYPIELTSVAFNWRTLLNMQLGGMLSSAESAQILIDLGHLLGAGVELAVALGTLASTTVREVIRYELEAMLRDIRMGGSLSGSIAESGVRLPPHIIAVIRGGELSGALAEALKQAGENLRRLAALRSKIRTALIYPICVSIAVAFAIFVLIVVVVPALETIFTNGMQRLPWQTRTLIVVGRFVREHVFGLAVLVLLFGIALRLMCANATIYKRLEIFALRTPVVGSLLASAETARISASLALLSASGVPLAKTIVIARDCARLIITRQEFSAAELKVREGAALHDALSGVRVLGPRVRALIRIGEITGRLNALLEEAARDSEQHVAMGIERLLALLTPVMTLAFGSIAGFVLYAVLTAILSVNELATVTH